MEFAEALDIACSESIKSLHSRALDGFDEFVERGGCECSECKGERKRADRTAWLSSAVACGADCVSKCRSAESLHRLFTVGTDYDEDEWFQDSEPIPGGPALWSLCIENEFWCKERRKIVARVFELMNITELSQIDDPCVQQWARIWGIP